MVHRNQMLDEIELVPRIHRVFSNLAVDFMRAPCVWEKPFQVRNF
jgi:hypothetical protein